MKKYIFHLLFIFVLFLFQTAAIKVFAKNLEFVPQLLLVWTLFFALSHSSTQTLWFSFFNGFLQELFSGQYFGAQILSFVLIGLTVHFLVQSSTPRGVGIFMTIFLVTSVTVALVFLIYLYNVLTGFLHLSKAAELKDLLSARLGWTVVSNLIFFFPIRFIFRLFRPLTQNS